FVRAYDRGHAIRLVQAGVEYQLRETFESALVFGQQVLIDLGFSHEQAAETIADVRRRDEERLSLQMVEGIMAGRSLMRGNVLTTRPEPWIKPRREGQALNEEAAEALEDEDEPQTTGG
ncbi:MAG: potassium transporter, partial [Brevundimonas sp.]|nr:potassium transporter [Brevundimonas sp.]